VSVQPSVAWHRDAPPPDAAEPNRSNVARVHADRAIRKGADTASRRQVTITSDTREDSQAGPAAEPVLVRIDLNKRGVWEVQLPDHDAPVGCKDLEQARRAAYRYAAGRRPCTLIARDAYQRVIGREDLLGNDDFVSPHGWFR